MAFVNFATREITAKIVYYGPGLGGKTTSLQYIHNSLSPENRGKMISLATEEDRTIYFDFLPLHLGKIQDFAVRVQLYTVPGQVRYNATRKLVLRGADGLVFVADSQRHKKMANIESFNNMEENLREHGKDLRDLPHILQFNKIDLPSRLGSEELNQLLNKYNVQHFDTCATSGLGILDALKSITKLVFNDLGKKALLQKKAKAATAAAVPYSAESAFAKRPAAPSSPEKSAPVPSYYGDSEYTSDLVPKQLSHPGTDHNYYGVTPPEKHAMDGPAVEALRTEEPASLEIHGSAEEVEPNPELERATFDAYEENMLQNPEDSATERFTYKQLFDSTGRFGLLMERLEKQIAAGEPDAAFMTAKALYSHVVADLYPRDYFLDGNESSLIVAMSIPLKRYLRFKHLLTLQNLEIQDLLFLHHFFTDLYLGLKEF